MVKPLTPVQLKLADELKVRKEELYELARTSRKKMIKAFQQYNKLLSTHEHFVEEHAKVDLKLHLLTPGIVMLKAVERKERALDNKITKPNKVKRGGAAIADRIGNVAMAEMLTKMIAEKKTKQIEVDKINSSST